MRRGPAQNERSIVAQEKESVPCLDRRSSRGEAYECGGKKQEGIHRAVVIKKTKTQNSRTFRNPARKEVKGLMKTKRRREASSREILAPTSEAMKNASGKIRGGLGSKATKPKLELQQIGCREVCEEPAKSILNGGRKGERRRAVDIIHIAGRGEISSVMNKKENSPGGRKKGLEALSLKGHSIRNFPGARPHHRGGSDRARDRPRLQRGKESR